MQRGLDQPCSRTATQPLHSGLKIMYYYQTFENLLSGRLQNAA